MIESAITRPTIRRSKAGGSQPSDRREDQSGIWGAVSVVPRLSPRRYVLFYRHAAVQLA